MKEKPDIAAWSTRYRTGLFRHLAQGPQASLRAAAKLGREAAALGLETLDVAQIHEQALKTVAAPSGSVRTRSVRRSRAFFEETIVPIEQTHAAAKEGVRREEKLSRTLRERTAESTASTRRLAKGVVGRQQAEAALGQSGERRTQMVGELRELEDRLHGQMRQILETQEDERCTTSLELQNEIAQILAAIHVRLLALKDAAKSNTESLKKEIAETQKLVKQSVSAIRRLSHEPGNHHET